MSIKRFGLGAIVASGLVCAGAEASIEIDIEGFSFETPPLAEGSSNPGPPPAWSQLGQGVIGVWNPVPINYPIGVPDGNNIAYVTDDTISQVTSATYEAGYVYTLLVDVGSRAQNPAADYKIGLGFGGTVLASSTGVTLSPGEFDAAEASLAVRNGDAVVGELIEISLSGIGSVQANFDNVQLLMKPIPAPAALALAGFAALIARRRR